MRGLTLGVVLLLGSASTAAAQPSYEGDDPEALTAPAPGVPEPPLPVEAEPPPPPPPSDRPAEHPAAGSRVVVEILGGGLGYLIGAGAGGLVGCGVGIPVDEDFGCVVGAVFGAVIGAGFGIAGGIDLAGDAMGGRGGYWPTYVGQLLGGVASLGVVLAVAGDRDTVPFGIGAMIVLPLAGGAIGYELSHARTAHPAP